MGKSELTSVCFVINDSQGVSGLVSKVAEMDASWKRLEMQSRGDLRQLTTQIANMVSAAKKGQNSLDLLIQTARSQRSQQQQTGTASGRNERADELLLFESGKIQTAVLATKALEVPDLVNLAGRMQQEGPKFESDLEFLDSLHFHGMKARQNGIKAAHSATFDWIFADTPTSPNEDRDDTSKVEGQPSVSSHGKEPRYFSRWLEEEGGIFWIHGKPGCGKSTLMKFISNRNNSKTHDKLRIWAAPKQVRVAHYYFWAAGSQLQRSQDGLLRSLIFEMITKCPPLLSIAKATLPEVDPFDSETKRWTLEQLLKTYKVMAAQDLGVRFCFFIDGLDEYYDSGKHAHDLIRTIRALEFSADIKLCISSRPNPVFDEEFGSNAERILRVEAHTFNDIRRYVSDKFETTTNFTNLHRRDTTYSKFVDEVAARAQGVFLWVVLVVASLEKGISNADSVVRLRKRLDTYPPDLDDFFLSMLRTVEKDYRKQAMRTFEMVTTALRPPHAMLFWYLYSIDDEPAKINMWKTVQRIQGKEVDDILKELRYNIQARSQGLLEVLEDEDHHPQAFFRFRVNFIHRTVRDFLRSSKAVKEQFQSELKDEGKSTWMIACHALLAVFKAAPSFGFREELFFEQLVKDIFYFASQEARSGKQQELARASAARWVGHAEKLFNEQVSTFTRRQPPRRFFLCQDAQYNFQDRLKARLKEHSAVLKLNQDGGRPVLDCALVPVPGEGPVHYSENIVKALLKDHANPRAVYEGKMVWARFIAHIADAPPGETDPRFRQALVAIVKLILSHDDKCLKVTVDTEGGSKSAEAVLREILTNEEQRKIPQLKSMSWFHSLFS